MQYTAADPVITTPGEVLAGLAGARDQLRNLEQGNVILAVEWAKHHPAKGLPRAAGGGPAPSVGPPPSRFEEGRRVWAELAAMGCLHFDDFRLPEFAIAAGLTEYSARKLLREALMLVHLLPRVWNRVLEGGLDVWRARALAADCWGLPFDAIEFIDAHMSDVTARITQTTRERILDEARHRFDPEEERTAEEEAQAAKGVEIGLDLEEHGVVPMSGALDLADALALEAALTTGAQALKDLGSDAPLNVRRSWALGDLARAASGNGVPLDQSGWASADAAAGAPAGSPVPPGQRPHWNGTGVSVPQVKLFIHVPPAPANGCPNCGVDDAVSLGSHARVEGSGITGTRVFNAERVKEWFTRPTVAGGCAPTVSVRTVMNLDGYYATGSYVPTDLIRDHVQLSHNGCVFPFCEARAWKCDADHNEPWKPDGEGGATCTCNLAPLCRRHHRLKTHSDYERSQQNELSEGEHATWVYAHLGGGEYYWRGPRGLGFIRSKRGTYEVAGSGITGAPVHPMATLTRDERVRQAEGTIKNLLAHAVRGGEPRHLLGEELKLDPNQKIPLTATAARQQKQASQREEGEMIASTAYEGIERETLDFLAWHARRSGPHEAQGSDFTFFTLERFGGSPDGEAA